MFTGDFVYVTYMPGGRRSVTTGGILRHITGIAVVLEPAEGEHRHRRIRWTEILEVSKIERPA